MTSNFLDFLGLMLSLIFKSGGYYFSALLLVQPIVFSLVYTTNKIVNGNKVHNQSGNSIAIFIMNLMKSIKNLLLLLYF